METLKPEHNLRRIPQGDAVNIVEATLDLITKELTERQDLELFQIVFQEIIKPNGEGDHFEVNHAILLYSRIHHFHIDFGPDNSHLIYRTIENQEHFLLHVPHGYEYEIKLELKIKDYNYKLKGSQEEYFKVLDKLMKYPPLDESPKWDWF